MTTSMTFGGVTVEQPDVAIEAERVFTGQQSEAHDGTLVTSYTNSKWKFKIKWSNLTLAQFTPILTAADTTTSQTMTLPFGATVYTVVVKQDTVRWRGTPTEDYYAIEFEAEELV